MAYGCPWPIRYLGEAEALRRPVNLTWQLKLQSLTESSGQVSAREEDQPGTQGSPPSLAPLQQKAPFPVPVRTPHRRTARTQSSAPSHCSAGLPTSGCGGCRPLPTRVPVWVQLQPWWSPGGPSLLLTGRPEPAPGAAQAGPQAALSGPASPGPSQHGLQSAAAVLKLLPSRSQHWGAPRAF